ncbi:MAG TPA: hypothetical protein VF976_12315 [Gemmatimonadales bacterium]
MPSLRWHRLARAPAQRLGVASAVRTLRAMARGRTPVTLRAATPSLAELRDDDLVDVHQVAKWIGCSERTIWRSGIPWVEITTRVKRFRVGDVRAWIAARVRGAA